MGKQNHIALTQTIFVASIAQAEYHFESRVNIVFLFCHEKEAMKTNKSIITLIQNSKFEYTHIMIDTHC